MKFLDDISYLYNRNPVYCREPHELMRKMEKSIPATESYVSIGDKKGISPTTLQNACCEPETMSLQRLMRAAKALGKGVAIVIYDEAQT